MINIARIVVYKGNAVKFKPAFQDVRYKTTNYKNIFHWKKAKKH